MINYTWEILNLNCAVIEDGMSNVVKEIQWRLMGENENGLSVQLQGVQNFTSPQPENFINYENLTKTIVISWLENTMDVNWKKSIIETKINEMSNYSTQVSLPLPYQE